MCCYLSLQEASGQLPKLKNEEVVTNACSLEAPPPPPHLGEPAGVERTQPLKEVDPDLGCGIRAPADPPHQVSLQPSHEKDSTEQEEGQKFPPRTPSHKHRSKSTALEILFTTRPLKLFSIPNHEK